MTLRARAKPVVGLGLLLGLSWPLCLLVPRGLRSPLGIGGVLLHPRTHPQRLPLNRICRAVPVNPCSDYDADTGDHGVTTAKANNAFAARIPVTSPRANRNSDTASHLHANANTSTNTGATSFAMSQRGNAKVGCRGDTQG